MDKVLNLMFIISIILTLLHFAFRNSVILIIIVFIGLFLLLYYLMKYPKKYFVFLIFINLFLIIYLIKSLYIQDLGFLSVFLFLISHIGLAIHIIENKKSLKILVYIYMIMNLVLIYYFFLGISPSDISEYSSENIVSFIYLSFSVLIIGLYYREKSQVLITPALLSTIVSFWTMGRSGIISSVIILVGIMLLKYKNKLNKLSISLVFIFLSIFGYYLINLVGELTQNVIYRFGERSTVIEGSPRIEIAKAYFSDLDLPKILFGQDVKEHYYEGFTNLHNSYLDVHYNFGFGGILIIFILISVLIYLFISRQYLYFILMFSLLLRAMTDTVLFGGMYDYVWIYFILIFIQDMHLKSKENQYKPF